MFSEPSAPAPTDPLPFLRSAREQLTGFALLTEQLAPEGALRGGVGEKAFREAMSPGLRAVVADYRESHRDRRLSLVRYTRSVDGRVDLILDAEQQAPDEDRLVHLTSATSAADRTGLHVVAEVLVARAEP